MAARDHRRQGGRRGGPRAGARRSRRLRRRGGPGPDAGDGDRRRRPRLGDLRRATSTAPARRPGWARSTTGSPATTSEAELLELVAELGADEEVDGILVQLPVPEQIDPDAMVGAIDPGKDVDGLTPLNAGLLAHGTPGLVPCTPAGVMELLAPRGGRAGGGRGGRRRPLEAGRRAGRPAAARRQRDRDRSATRAPATSPRPAPAPTSSSPRSACRACSAPRRSSPARW